MRLMRRVLSAFAKELEKAAQRVGKQKGGLPNLKDTSDEHLKAERTKLASYIKKGMLERKDMEVEIALQAAIVWILRMEKEKKARILEMW
jgi:hypothetical protein